LAPQVGLKDDYPLEPLNHLRRDGWIVQQRYVGIDFNPIHLPRSFICFDEAEAEPMPRMLTKVDWSRIRRRLEVEVRNWAS